MAGNTVYIEERTVYKKIIIKRKEESTGKFMEDNIEIKRWNRA